MRISGLIAILLIVVSIMLVACGSDPTAAPAAPKAPVASTTSKPAAQPAAKSEGQTLEQYAAEHAGGPGAIYIGDPSQLVGDAPHEDLGGFDGEVPLDMYIIHISEPTRRTPIT